MVKNGKNLRPLSTEGAYYRGGIFFEKKRGAARRAAPKKWGF